jgi:hypothetical protein
MTPIKMTPDEFMAEMNNALASSIQLCRQSDRPSGPVRILATMLDRPEGFMMAKNLIGRGGVVQIARTEGSRLLRELGVSGDQLKEWLGNGTLVYKLMALAKDRVVQQQNQTGRYIGVGQIWDDLGSD